MAKFSITATSGTGTALESHIENKTMFTGPLPFYPGIHPPVNTIWVYGEQVLRHLGPELATVYLAYQGIKYTRTKMPGLRGTKRRMAKTSPRLAKLERQVQGLKPSVESWQFAYSPGITSGWNKAQLDLTEDFKATGQFGNSVLGDRYKNLSLKHTHYFSPQILQARVLVYFHRRVGASFNPNNDGAGFVNHPDPAFIHVVSDRYLTPPNGTTGFSVSFNDSLRGRQTIINRNNAILEAGELSVLIMWNSSGIGGIKTDTQLFYLNK